MPVINSLTREASVKLGPILLSTLLKHYFDRILKEHVSDDKALTQLRKEELLYDEAFIVIKMFLEAASKHTVEDVQEFGNTRTPSPPWVHVVKVVIPMTCCDEAAGVVIKALGGEEMTKKIVGGTKWWQVRGLKGVDGEWIVTKKDWQEAKKRYKAQEQQRSSPGRKDRKSGATSTNSPSSEEDATPSYQPDMDEMRCILYAHGGGYFFGSVDQERYAIQRFARKVNGRVFAISYRLAPQYPFPCALQDLIAAYLFLIRPPEGALHRPVNPAHIVVGGDSAGGGLTLALLQVLRDCGLPMPSGGILISPWCDLTHSFPSIHTNTATDIIPPWGLSFQKPSTLWPPPPDDLTTRVHDTLRLKIRDVVTSSKHSRSNSGGTPQSGENDLRLPQTGQTLHLGSTASLPTLHSSVRDQAVQCMTKAGKLLRIEDQIHMYTPNYLLHHPLVSPVLSYLGGLPPLLVIASDGEVLRDEVIYMAHKAAYPARFPIKQEIRDLYPALNGIEERFGPTQVHLQVYDDAAHTLPILFAFTTPAKYCFRAIATFIRHVTGMSAATNSDNILDIPITHSPPTTPGLLVSDSLTLSPIASNTTPPQSSRPLNRRQTLKRAFSTRVSRASTLLKGHHKNTTSDASNAEPPDQQSGIEASSSVNREQPEKVRSEDTAGPRFYGSGMQEPDDGVRRAGEPSVYENPIRNMIRERVSIHGVVRPLEPEDQLQAFSLPSELIGVVSELAMRRYIDAQAKFGKKFSKTYKDIEKRRNKHLAKAKKNGMPNTIQLQAYLDQEKGQINKGIADGLITTGSWSWAWALDMDERPPASSIVARRDTREAIQLARIADQSILAEESIMSGNNLWTLMANFLTTTPEKKDKNHHKNDTTTPEDKKTKEKRIRSKFAQLVSDHTKSGKIRKSMMSERH
ncbi:Alpha/Beta hydrolase protein [Cytidiella melzeri]|nr:Alpha/Beta hydrolase protein [Cytidiella melzeri]